MRCARIGCTREVGTDGVCVEHRGRVIARRVAACSLCHSRAASEVLISTVITPQGAWIKVCRRCGT